MPFQHATPTTGTDPEMFIVSKTGRPRAGRRYFKADREKNDTIIHDNIAIELRPAPATCCAHLQDYTAKLLPPVKAKIDKAKIATSLSFIPALKVAKKELAMGGMEFGCSPAFNLSPMGETNIITPRVSPDETQIRSIGYHVHFGADQPLTEARRLEQIAEQKKLYGWIPSYLTDGRSTKPKPGQPIPLNWVIHDTTYRIPLIFMFDTFLGTFGVLMESYLGIRKQADQRRNLIGYGRASEFRTPKHGVEYRTLSSWPMMHPLLQHAVHYLARDCVVGTMNLMPRYVLTACPPDETADAINAGDVKACETIFMKGIKAYENGAKKESKTANPRISGSSFLDGNTPYAWLAVMQSMSPEEGMFQYGDTMQRRPVITTEDEWAAEIGERKIVPSGAVEERRWNPKRVNDYFLRWKFSSHSIGCQSWAERVLQRYPDLKPVVTSIKRKATKLSK